MPYKDKAVQARKNLEYRARPDVRERRRARRAQEREAEHRRRADETAEERDLRLAKERPRDRLRIINRTPEQRIAWAAYRRGWGKQNQKAMNIYESGRRVGVTVDEIAAMLEKQDYSCPLCDRVLPRLGEPRKQNDMHVDHDHKTGRFRGMLCGGCNGALGKLGDDVDGLQRALDYVRGPTQSELFQ